MDFYIFYTTTGTIVRSAMMKPEVAHSYAQLNGYAYLMNSDHIDTKFTNLDYVDVNNEVIIVPSEPEVDPWQEPRNIRDALLSKSDWTQLQDSPLSTQKLAEWATYRQLLRDITTQDPDNITWPDTPE